MENKLWSFYNVVDIVVKNIKITDHNHQSVGTEVLRKLSKLQFEEEPPLSKVHCLHFKFTTEEQLDIVELTKKLNCNNLFGYFVANHLNGPLEKITDKILSFLYSKEETEMTRMYSIVIDKYIKEKNVSKTQEGYETIKIEIVDKLRIYAEFAFYMFCLGIYKPDCHLSCDDLLTTYREWIKETTMETKKKYDKPSIILTEDNPPIATIETPKIILSN